MTRLIDRVNDAGLYRTVFGARVGVRPICMVFRKEFYEDAVKWALTATGKKPAYASFVPAGETEIQQVNLAFLAENPSIETVVFGRGERAHAIRLAASGVRTFKFAVDPGYKNFKFESGYFSENRDNLERMHALLADEESKQTLASVIKQRITGDHGCLRIASYAEYEHPVVKPEMGDWVADCGASNGATSFHFSTQVGDEGIVFAFEPDPSNVAKIEAGKQKIRANNVHIVNAALSNTPGLMRFSSANGGSSMLSDDGDIEVKVETLDRFAQEHNLTGNGVLSFDVEGYEREALEGGLSLIKATRPKLQISAYHKMHDLFSLALWLDEELKNYTFYMGHHDAYHCETDVYAIPTETIGRSIRAA